MDLLRQFRQHCTTRQLVHPDDRLLLAVSGGLDSRVMLDLFAQLRPEWQLLLAIGHVNHQMRGVEADEDEAFVKALADEAKLPFFSQHVAVPDYAKKQKLSLETAARELRYQILESFCHKWNARAIVTAHTLDDQAETVLDHILRGCGLNGLSGMPAKQNAILRPLLPFSRAQIEEYARSRKLSWREDYTNTDLQFRRNRIRHELLPLIKDSFNPQIAHSLERLAKIAGSAEAYFRAEAEGRLPEIVKETQPEKIVLDIEQFWKYFLIIQSYMVRAVIRKLVREEVEPTFAETARILELLQSHGRKTEAALGHEDSIFASTQHTRYKNGKRFIWRNRIELLIDHEGAVFQRLEETKGEGRRARGEKQEAKSAGRGAKSEGRSSVPVRIGERCLIPGTHKVLLVEQKTLPQGWREQVSAYSQFVDRNKVKGELHVRFPQRGDRFVPLRVGSAEDMAGSKKLSDFFIDLKVPLHRRSQTPILECGDIIWICGYRIDNRFKITPSTQTVLHLQLLPQPAS
jgi:tRNA(Ile)-lysidine synthase